MKIPLIKEEKSGRFPLFGCWEVCGELGMDVSLLVSENSPRLSIPFNGRYVGASPGPGGSSPPFSPTNRQMNKLKLFLPLFSPRHSYLPFRNVFRFRHGNEIPLFCSIYYRCDRWKYKRFTLFLRRDVPLLPTECPLVLNPSGCERTETGPLPLP